MSVHPFLLPVTTLFLIESITSNQHAFHQGNSITFLTFNSYVLLTLCQYKEMYYLFPSPNAFQ